MTFAARPGSAAQRRALQVFLIITNNDVFFKSVMQNSTGAHLSIERRGLKLENLFPPGAPFTAAKFRHPAFRAFPGGARVVRPTLLYLRFSGSKGRGF
jgi:hypothetical protein